MENKEQFKSVMKKHIRAIALCSFLSAAVLFAFTGCSSTRTENGVTIEKEPGNPLKFW